MITQILMHLSEPFVHRYIIRGTFSQENSKGWHSTFLVFWAFIYLHILVSSGFNDWIMVLVKGAALRFVAQSILLNYLMVRDGHQGRTWHDLRDTGVDQAVQNVMRYPAAWLFYGKQPSQVTGNLIQTTEKFTIITGVILTSIIVWL